MSKTNCKTWSTAAPGCENGAQPPSAVNGVKTPLAKPGKDEYRRNLPHLQSEDRTIFLTFCTKNRWCLPESVRSEESKSEKVDYICANPVRRGLCRNESEYPWIWREWFEGQSAAIPTARGGRATTLTAGGGRAPSSTTRRGIVLVIVLVVVAMLAMACLGFTELMLNERKAAWTAARQSQARMLAQSGIELARQFLDREATDRNASGGLYDNPQRFANVVIAGGDSPMDQGFCSLVAPRLEDRAVAGVRYGLQDESARINLATILQLTQQQSAAGRSSGASASGGGSSSGGSSGGSAASGNASSGSSSSSSSSNAGSTGGGSSDAAKMILMALPGMTDIAAESILDWIDSDNTPRINGAELDYYGSLTPAYAPRNGPPASIEELLLVRGVTPQLLFGADAARRGLIPVESVSGGSIAGVDNSDGSMTHGWAAYFTLWSAETTAKPDGSPKINLNQNDLQALYNELTAVLDESAAKFIVAYRAYGPSSADSQTIQAGQPAASADVAVETLRASATIGSVLDLIGATVEIPQTQSAQGNQNGQNGQNGQSNQGGQNNSNSRGNQNAQQKKYLKSPFAEDSGTMTGLLPKLLDNATVQTGSSIPGRININQAPRAVLASIPGMTSEIIDRILTTRVTNPTLAPQNQQYEVWPLMEGIVPLATMKKLQPYVTAGGNVYRVQSVGVFAQPGPVGRIEAVLDATQRPTQLLLWKDVSRLPGAFFIEPAGEGLGIRD